MSTVKHTSRLQLRPVNNDDASDIFRIYGDPKTNLHNPFGPYENMDKAIEVLRERLEHWRQYGFGLWAISSLTAPENVIGYGGLSFRKYGAETKLNLGYRFAPEAWGHGFATEFGMQALQTAFDELQQEQVCALVRPTNLASIRVLEKLGMLRVGSLDDVPGLLESYVYAIDRASYTSH